jgi:excisionase family DNA binding protein
MTERGPKEEGGAQLFTASDIARFCQVDLKTIHNWSEKGEIRHFRTPGRHLRFRRLDVLDFLRKYGYPVPQALRAGKPRVVVVDENAEQLGPLRRALGRRFELTTFSDPFEALVSLSSIQPDALVLDTDLDVMDGPRLVERLATMPLTSYIRTIVYAAADPRKKHPEAGVQEFVAKGQLAQLREALERLTGLDRGE